MMALQENWQRLRDSSPFFVTHPAGTTSKTTASLAWEDVTKQVGLHTGMYGSGEYSFMLLYGCSILGFFCLAIIYRSIVSAERFPKKKTQLRLAEYGVGSYAESEAYHCASVVLIYTRLELSSDSDSDSDSDSCLFRR